MNKYFQTILSLFAALVMQASCKESKPLEIVQNSQNRQTVQPEQNNPDCTPTSNDIDCLNVSNGGGIPGAIGVPTVPGTLGGTGIVGGSGTNGIVTPVVTNAVKGSIKGFAYVDANNNNVFDAGDEALSDLWAWFDGTGDGRMSIAGDPAAKTNSRGYFDLPKVLPVGKQKVNISGRAGLKLLETNSYKEVYVDDRGRVVPENLTFRFVREQDFGDAPAPYDSSFSVGIIPDWNLGAVVSTETEPKLSGDDGDDGVEFLDAFVLQDRGSQVTARLTPGKNWQQGFIGAWIDFNGDGVFDNVLERVIHRGKFEGPQAQDFKISVPTPAFSVPGKTWARFRYCLGLCDSANAPGKGGEIEDYPIDIIAAH